MSFFFSPSCIYLHQGHIVRGNEKLTENILVYGALVWLIVWFALVVHGLHAHRNTIATALELTTPQVPLRWQMDEGTHKEFVREHSVALKSKLRELEVRFPADSERLRTAMVFYNIETSADV